jgi:hypothetical protein
MVESMSGLEGWTFPREWTAIEGDRPGPGFTPPPATPAR